MAYYKYTAGFVGSQGRKLACLALLLKDDSSATEYVHSLSKGGLMTLSQYLSDHVCHCIVILDILKKNLLRWNIPNENEKFR